MIDKNQTLNVTKYDDKFCISHRYPNTTSRDNSRALKHIDIVIDLSTEKVVSTAETE